MSTVKANSAGAYSLQNFSSIDHGPQHSIAASCVVDGPLAFPAHQEGPILQTRNAEGAFAYQNDPFLALETLLQKDVSGAISFFFSTVLNPDLTLPPEKSHAYGTKTLTYLIKLLNLCSDIKNRKKIVDHLQALSDKQFIFFCKCLQSHDPQRWTSVSSLWSQVLAALSSRSFPQETALGIFLQKNYDLILKTKDPELDRVFCQAIYDSIVSTSCMPFFTEYVERQIQQRTPLNQTLFLSLMSDVLDLALNCVQTGDRFAPWLKKLAQLTYTDDHILLEPELRENFIGNEDDNVFLDNLTKLVDPNCLVETDGERIIFTILNKDAHGHILSASETYTIPLKK